MIIPLEENFSDVTSFDLAAASRLAKYFDIDYVKRDHDEYDLWFKNISVLASQNFGLAHSVLHNQTARNSINIAYHKTGLETFNKPYESNVGTYSFFKGLSKFKGDTMTLDGTRLNGTKYWASQIDTANFVVANVWSPIKSPDIMPIRVYLDLTQINHERMPSSLTPIGMQLAAPGDFTVDNIDIPFEWRLEPFEEYKQVNVFHYYGLTYNYITLTRDLITIAKRQGFAVDYMLDKLHLDLDVALFLQHRTLDTVCHPVSEPVYDEIHMKWKFARKNLVQTIQVFLEIMNTGHGDSESKYSEKFRDAIMMASHVVSLYKHLTGPVLW